MMLLQSWSFSSALPSHSLSHGLIKKHVNWRNREETIVSGKLCYVSLGRNDRALSYPTRCFSKLAFTNTEVVDLIQNKVLIAAAVSATIGQLSKPFTSTLFYGNNFDFKAAFQAGGFPSTHSSTVVATATTLGLERGFSDAIFGLAVVYACLTMYDAQGVRREVGRHAKTLNGVLLKSKLNPLSSNTDGNNLRDSFEGELSDLESHDPHFLGRLESFQPRPPNASFLLECDDRIQGTAVQNTSGAAPVVKRKSESSSFDCTPLKESIGHTEIEVVAGALLGFFVGLAVFTM